MGYYNSRPKTIREQIRDAVERIDNRIPPPGVVPTDTTGLDGYYNDRPKTSIERIRDAVEEIDEKLNGGEEYEYATVTNVTVASITDGADNVPMGGCGEYKAHDLRC